MSLHPGLKRPTSQSLRRGWLFGVTYHNMRGAIASATAAWAILLDRSAVMGKCSNSSAEKANCFLGDEILSPAEPAFRAKLSQLILLPAFHAIRQRIAQKKY